MLISDMRRRIDLIQDFEMPTVSNEVKVCPNQQYIFATGTYITSVNSFNTDSTVRHCFETIMCLFPVKPFDQIQYMLLSVGVALDSISQLLYKISHANRR